MIGNRCKKYKKGMKFDVILSFYAIFSFGYYYEIRRDTVLHRIGSATVMTGIR